MEGEILGRKLECIRMYRRLVRCHELSQDVIKLVSVACLDTLGAHHLRYIVVHYGRGGGHISERRVMKDLCDN